MKTFLKYYSHFKEKSKSGLRYGKMTKSEGKNRKKKIIALAVPGDSCVFPFVCHNELPAAFRFLWVACISMIFAVNAGFALILAPFLRKNDCVSLMVGEPRRFFLQIGLFMAAASRYNMKTTWRKDTVSFLATDHAGNTPGAQIKRYHPLSFCYRWAIIAVGGGYCLAMPLFEFYFQM